MDCLTRLKIDTNAFAIKHVHAFKASRDRGSMAYAFPLPCHVTAPPPPKVVILTAFDSNDDCALFFVQNDPPFFLGPCHGPILRFKFDS
ncbi:MAG: hypothetical protein JEZ12_09330 [Desulfobacterium sp.]|nr:hypothetical protein [Desulfobacterium sp.]